MANHNDLAVMSRRPRGDLGMIYEWFSCGMALILRHSGMTYERCTVFFTASIRAKMAVSNKTNQLQVRLSADENAQFSLLAAQFGLSKSDACRRAVLAALGDGPVLAEQSRLEFLTIAEQIRTIGVSVTEAVRAMNTGRVPDDEGLRRDLADLRVGMEALAEVLVMMGASAKRKAGLAFRGEALLVRSV